MPQLQIPLRIWLSATPSERDGFYIAAGFDPNLPVRDNGTDNQTVRFIQGPAAPVAVPDLPTPVPITVATTPQSGDDTRDFQTISLTGDNPITDEFGTPAPIGDPGGAVAIGVAGRALRLVMGGGGGRLIAATWNSLPSLVRTSLAQIGIGVGALIAFNGDIPFITLPGQGNGEEPFIGPRQAIVGGGGPVDIQIGSNPLQPVQIVGSWVANNVVFWRLADGKLAVQNKKGRWKVWRPKKPIVLYADGASNLKTMLRADKALNKQAKKIAAMLNRRSGSRKSTPKPQRPIIIQRGSGQIIDG